MKIFTLSFFLFLGFHAFSVNYYVDSAAMGTHNGISWSSAFDSLQPALKIARSGDTIFIAKGTYLPTNTSDRSKYFNLPSGVRLLGGYPTGGGTRDIKKYKTILSGNIGLATADTDNTYHVIFCNMSAPGTEINGLYITKGYADGDGDDANGGGIYVKNHSSRYYHVIITDCEIYGNYAAGGGGGINITQKGDIYHCVIRDNRSKGAGGGIMLIDDARAYNTLIINNYSKERGGGVYLKGFNSAPGLFGCIISNNETPGDGGGIYQLHDGRVYNCTIVRNQGKTGYYHGIYSYVANNIVWGNAGNQINRGRLPSLHYCAIGCPGEDLSTADKSIVLDSINTGISGTTFYPVFRNPSDSTGNVSTPEGRKNIFQANWYLNPGSACINRGDNKYFPDLKTDSDIYHHARISDSVLDIGAIEAFINLTTDSVHCYADSVCFFGTVLFSADSNQTQRNFEYGSHPDKLTATAFSQGTGSYSFTLKQHLAHGIYYYHAGVSSSGNYYPTPLKRFANCPADTVFSTHTICRGDNFSFPDGTKFENIASDTTYLSKLTAQNGCDSLILTTLTVFHPDTLVWVHGDTLTAKADTGQFQWLNCNNNHSVIDGADNQSYTPPENGLYAVVVTQNNCTDTSSCHAVTQVSIPSRTIHTENLVYPNPSTGKLHLRSSLFDSAPVKIEIFNLTGKLVFRTHEKVRNINLSGLDNGLYFIKIETVRQIYTFRFMLKKN